MSGPHRTIYCGKVTQEQLGKTIQLAGWVNKRRDHGGLIFIDLRDRSGIMQLVFNPDFSEAAHKLAHALRSEYVIEVSGNVVKRSDDTINAGLPTGELELQVTDLKVLNSAKGLPFMLDEAANVDEELRLKYRYLDLRRPAMLQKMILRDKICFAIRQFLHKQDFLEIETPILTKNSPEGAREFLVPSRIRPGYFYALPQSPQLYKQLLMAAGIEKYFQIARCFRDEDTRADRQPEFTQLDMELSFINEEDVMRVVEQLFAYIFKQVLGKEFPLPLPHITYDRAIADYGTDAPDTRFGLLINDISEAFHDTELKFLRSVLDNGGKVGCIHVSGHKFSRSDLDGWVNKAQKLGAKGLLWMRVGEGGQKIDSPVSKFLPDDFFKRLQKHIPSLAQHDTLFIIAGNYKTAWQLLGRLRLEIAKELKLIPEGLFNFVWVTDFPLLEYDEGDKRWYAVHHPFTAPQEGWQDQEPGAMKARAYDLVLNGTELGGGSIRIHERDMQQKVFDLLGLSDDEVQNKFGFLLESQELGFPPLGGIAFGLDRILMILTGSRSIREVIAFPKTQRGFDAMMEAPSAADPKQLREYGLKIIKEARNEDKKGPSS